MLAFSILIHALRQIFDNLRGVFILGAPILILTIALRVIEYRTLGLFRLENLDLEGMFAFAPPINSAMPTGLMLAGMAANMVLFLLFAVSWHRSILLAEPPRMLAPGRARQAGGYALGVLGISLLAVLPIIALGIPLAMLGLIETSGLFPSVGNLVVEVVAMTLALRLGTTLPGVALRRDEPLVESWRATRGHLKTFVLLAVTAVSGKTAAPFIALIMAGTLTHGVLGLMVISVLLSCLGGLIMLSVLTSLWGHFVEGRALR
ncbi:hypothetical protein [Paracoccus sp. NSM]|uniref:hypothetical protein n=1 Tax=Paracoccus sp. NSM TaxID=3457784 RepID=UPI00403599DE